MKTRYSVLCAVAIVSSVIALFRYGITGQPDRAQFIQECLDARATSQTAKFNDYNEFESYHIDKRDLILGIEEATQSQPGRLRAVIIFGPGGPLWTYHVIVALSEESSVRLNSLVMPHARITGKGTRTLTGAEFEQLLEKLMTSKLLIEGDVAPIKAGEYDPFAQEFEHDFVVVSWTGGRRTLRYGALENLLMKADPAAKEAETLLEQVNTMLQGITTTYPNEK